MGKHFFSGNYSSLSKEANVCACQGAPLWFRDFSDYDTLRNKGFLKAGDVVVMPDRLGREKSFCLRDDGKMSLGDVVLDKGRRVDDVFAVEDVYSLLTRI